MTIGKLATISAALAFASLACDARTLIGMVPDGSAPDGGPGQASADASVSSTGDGGHTCTPVTFQGEAPFTLPAGVAGNWTGYFQGGSPLQTSDVVKLSIQQMASGMGEIRVTMGTAAPPAPATSATDNYPPGGTGTGSRLPAIIEGFSYIARVVTWQGTRLKFVLPGAQPWESWCALQTSYFVADHNEYNCVPGSGGTAMYADAGAVCISEDGPKMTQVACAQFEMCNQYFCACDACGCSAAAEGAGEFDITFDGDVATGVGQTYDVRLMRSAN